MKTNAIYQCVLFFMQINFLQAQSITVQTKINPTELVQEKLLGKGIQALNVKYSGFEDALGFFTCDSTKKNDLGFNKGIILTTGNANDAKGPNSSTHSSSANYTPGDTDLEKILEKKSTTYDAAVLEFDFIPTSDTLKFKFFFASDEYPEFVGNKYNDVFAFFISGPGYDSMKNIALLPGDSQVVNINNINPYKNQHYYVDNLDGKNIEFDGYTRVFIASAKVQPDQVYHIKIAIADVADQEFDSGVFLEANSFESKNSLTIENNSNLLYEGCGNGEFTIAFSDTIKKKTIIPLSFSGNAKKNVDYFGIPDSLIFFPGEIKKSIKFFTTFNPEKKESRIIIIKLPTSFRQQSKVDSILFEIKQFEALSIQNDTNFTYCFTDVNYFHPSVKGGSGNYFIDFGNLKNIKDSIFINFNENKTEQMKITDRCTGKSIFQNIHFKIIKPLSEPILYCNSDSSKEFYFKWNTIKNATSYEYKFNNETDWTSTTDTSIDFQNSNKMLKVDFNIRAIGANSCETSLETQIACTYFETPVINIPTAFTPNGDGINDEFKIYSKGIQSLYVKIYSRWGHLIYSGENLETIWSPQKIENGLYVYEIQYTTQSNLIQSVKGVVSVVN